MPSIQEKQLAGDGIITDSTAFFDELPVHLFETLPDFFSVWGEGGGVLEFMVTHIRMNFEINLIVNLSFDFYQKRNNPRRIVSGH
ncbi:hypothetical protein AXI59_15710 [Bacillus nakamurai]|nr:hypothetical protein AXI59_15710 [Bacillus nakamurai]